MNPIPYNPDANWEDLHSSLRDHLQEEVRLTRELLSNMHQEELSLILSDHGTLNQVISEQSRLFERLSILRLNRHTLTVRIEKIVIDNKKIPSVEELLPLTEEISMEILSLTDQLVSLTERMSRQYGQNRNAHLQGDKYGRGHFQHAVAPRPKAKACVATYNLNKYT